MDFVEKLPTETWIQIASFFNKDDLTRLSRTCRFLLAVSRILLYQDVDLDNSEEGFNTSYMIETLRLLSFDPSLARCIRRFYICHREPEGQNLESVQLMVDALANATSLRALFVGPCFFQSASQQETFVKYMGNRSSPLRFLYYWGEPLPTCSFGIPHLRDIEWNTATGPELWSLLHASRDTIETLKIDLSVVLPDIDSAPLWEMHFPKLYSIEIGGAVSYDVFERKSTNTFFRTHAFNHKLDYVGLDHSVYGESGFFLHDFKDETSPSSFKALQDRHLKVSTLKGAPAFIAYIAEHHILHVKNVLVFDILHPTDVEDSMEIFLEFDSMFEHLQVLSEDKPCPIFPYLHTFCAELEPFSRKWEDHTTLKDDCLRMVERAAKLFGVHLLRWSTIFPPFDISAEELGSAFSMFRDLDDIYLPLHIMGGLEKMEEYALGLAKKCPVLVEIHVADEELYPKAYHLLMISRKEDNVSIVGRSLEDAFIPIERLVD